MSVETWTLLNNAAGLAGLKEQESRLEQCVTWLRRREEQWRAGRKDAKCDRTKEKKEKAKAY